MSEVEVEVEITPKNEGFLIQILATRADESFLVEIDEPNLREMRSRLRLYFKDIEERPNSVAPSVYSPTDYYFQELQASSENGARYWDCDVHPLSIFDYWDVSDSLLWGSVMGAIDQYHKEKK